MKRTALSLFVDDTHFEPHGQMEKLLDFCIEQDVRGKCSLIAALNGRLGGPFRGESGTPAETAFLSQLNRAAAHGFDLHMELLTHGRLWDFQAGHPRDSGPCEGIWLYDPSVPLAEYETYLGAILDLAARAGVILNGISVPGCDCDACARLWADLQASGHSTVSRNAYAAILKLATEGRFGVDCVAVNADEADAEHPTQIIGKTGRRMVFDARLDMSVADQIGFDGRHDPDFYISADGRHGRIAELVLSGADQCFFCAHWFSKNPTKPEGWQVFQEIIRRINTTLCDRIKWVRPSDYGASLSARMAAGGPGSGGVVGLRAGPRNALVTQERAQIGRG